MNDRDISELVIKYEQMLQSEKSIYFDAEEFDMLAEYYEIHDDLQIAKKIIEQGLQIHLNNHSLMLKKAKHEMYGGLYNKALEYLNLQFSSYGFDLYLLKIECLLQLGLYAEAYQLTVEVLADDDVDIDIILSELGFIYVEADYFDEAILYFEKSLIYNPENMDVLSDLSYAYEMKDNFAAAIKITNKILDIDPYAEEAWVNMGKLYSLQEQFDEAIDAFDFAITINESDKNVLKMKAHCLSLAERTEEAILAFNECLVFSPDDESLYFSLSECYLGLEQYDNALEILDTCQDTIGISAKLYSKKAFALLQKGQQSEAKNILNLALQIDKNTEDVNLIAGEIAFSENNLVEAENYYLKAFELNSENEVLLDKLALICISKDNFSKAAEYMEYLLTIDPNSSTKIRLALLYFELENIEKFNSTLNSFKDEELKELLSLFFPEGEFDLKSISRDELIGRLNDARNCRQLFKNIKH